MYSIYYFNQHKPQGFASLLLRLDLEKPSSMRVLKQDLINQRKGKGGDQ